jgi:thiamine phosphate synthase YjbQ (UPF0047 family)
MRFATEYLTFNTRKHRECINITGDVERVVADSGIRDGGAVAQSVSSVRSVADSSSSER